MKLSCDYVVGTGGVGQGILFQLEENHTMGRNESRQAQLTDSQDYCKLHIILHYIATFLNGDLPVYAISRVGADEQGKQLKKIMSKAGIDVSCVSEDKYHSTMYAVCYQYPNGECCNISTENSACMEVGKTDIDYFFQNISPKGRGVIFAIPEVPLSTRIYFLEIGRKKGCCNVASVLSAEVVEFVVRGGVEKTDILSINEDEAEMFAKLDKENYVKGTDVVKACVVFLQKINPDICVIVTQGEKGAYVQWKEKVYRNHAIDVPVVNTAGAGDCFIATVIAALLKGNELFPTGVKIGEVGSALDLGSVASAKKIGCKDTIDFSMSLESLWTFSQEHGIVFSNCLYQFFKNLDKKG